MSHEKENLSSSLVFQFLYNTLRKQSQTWWLILGLIMVWECTTSSMVMPLAPCTCTTPITRQSYILNKHRTSVVVTRVVLRKASWSNEQHIDVQGPCSTDLSIVNLIVIPPEPALTCETERESLRTANSKLGNLHTSFWSEVWHTSHKASFPWAVNQTTMISSPSCLYVQTGKTNQFLYKPTTTTISGSYCLQTNPISWSCGLSAMVKEVSYKGVVVIEDSRMEKRQECEEG